MTSESSPVKNVSFLPYTTFLLFYFTTLLFYYFTILRMRGFDIIIISLLFINVKKKSTKTAKKP